MCFIILTMNIRIIFPYSQLSRMCCLSYSLFLIPKHQLDETHYQSTKPTYINRNGRSFTLDRVIHSIKKPTNHPNHTPMMTYVRSDANPLQMLYIHIVFWCASWTLHNIKYTNRIPLRTNATTDDAHTLVARVCCHCRFGFPRCIHMMRYIV